MRVVHSLVIMAVTSTASHLVAQQEAPLDSHDAIARWLVDPGEDAVVRLAFQRLSLDLQAADPRIVEPARDALELVASSSSPLAGRAAGILADDDLAWVARLGGAFERDASRPDRPIIALSLSLRPEIFPSSIRVITSKTASDAFRRARNELQRLGRFPHVESLRLECVGNWGAIDGWDDDAAVRHVILLPALRALDMSGSSVRAAGLQHLAALQQLVDLDLSNCPHLGDDAVAAIGRILSLERLDLSPCPKLTSAGLRHLCDLPHLRWLDISATNRFLSESGWLSGLRGWYRSDPNVRSDPFTEQRGGVTDDDIECLVAKPTLRHLGLGQTRITDEGCRRLGQLRGLESLDLSRTAVTDSGVAHLADLTSLQSLDLRSTFVRGGSLPHLQRLTHLRTLVLRGTSIADGGLERLGTLKELRHLDLHGCPVTGLAVAALPLPKLRVLKVGRTEMNFRSIMDLPKVLPELDVVALIADLPWVSADDRAPIATLIAPDPSLDDDDLALLIPLMSDVRSLDLGGTQITDAGLEHVAGLESLRRLSIESTAVGDQGLRLLASLRELESVEMRGSRATLGGLARLAAEWPERRDDFLSRSLRADTSWHSIIDLRGIERSEPELDIVADLEAPEGLIVQGLTTPGLARLTDMAELEFLWISEGTIGPDAPELHLPNPRGLRVLWLTDSDLGGDPELAGLPALPALEALNLSGTPLGDGAVERLIRLPSLRSLIVDPGALSPAALDRLGAARPGLRIDITQRRALAAVRGFERRWSYLPQGISRREEMASVGTKVDGPEELIRLFGDAYFEVADRVEMSSITLDQARRVRDLTTVHTVSLVSAEDGRLLPFLEGLASLRELSLYRAGVVDADLIAVGRLGSLESLDLRRSTVTGTGMVHLTGLTRLRRLSLGGYGTSIDDEALRHVSKIASLEELDLTRTDITDAGLAHLEVMERLRRLALRETRATVAGIEAIRTALPRCRIDYPSAPVTRAAAEGRGSVLALQRLGASVRFGSSGASVDLRDVADLEAAIRQLASLLSIFSVEFGPNCTDRHVEQLVAIDGIDSISSLAFRASAIGDHSLARLAALHSLATLSLSGCGVTDAGVAHLAGLDNLWHLNLGGTSITDAGLLHLPQLDRLADLSLNDTVVGDEGIIALANLSLKGLGLSHTRVTDAGVEALRHLPALEVLHLSGTCVTDAAVSILAEFWTLRGLSVNQTEITDAGRDRLRRSLPDCSIHVGCSGPPSSVRRNPP